MKQVVVLAIGFSLATALTVTSPQERKAHAGSTEASGAQVSSVFMQREVKSQGRVTVEGHKIAYEAVAGTIIVHPKGWDDVTPQQSGRNAVGSVHGPPVASMFYVAYFERGANSRARPITFLYNGGPGSATIWLHMGAFGPVRVVTNDAARTPSAPYGEVNNDYSLLDASDLVFIDAPGTGYSRIQGNAARKAFYGVDQDGHAFASFIVQFLTKYGRWNSPKYLYGESYGTPRSAVLINDLETDRFTDFNGVILLSQILNFGLNPDSPQFNPGVELPYQIALPTYAATAWFHHMLPSNPVHLQPFLKQVEQFAMGQYADALTQGADLSQQDFDAVAQKLHEYTGLPVAYIKKANLRVSGPEFEKTLLGDSDLTMGRLDTRFSGPTMDPLSEFAEYDPEIAGISSAYVAAFNDYVHRVLHYTTDLTYRPLLDEVYRWWDFRHQPPGAPMPLRGAANVMPDLATAMKYDPDLKICLNGGYFDLATPFFEGWYEMHHLQIPKRLQSNIEYHYYKSGHVLYVQVPVLKQLHDNVAAFIRKTAKASVQ